jgi:hypothetical protein
VERLVDLVVTLRVAAMDERAQLLVRGLEWGALGRDHALGGEPRAQRLKLSDFMAGRYNLLFGHISTG